jgi:hypothetical protein
MFKEGDESRTDERAERTYAAARDLGLLDSAPPTLSKPDHLLILGGLATGVEPRVRYAAKLLADGTISTGSVVALGSFRVLDQREQPAAAHYAPGAKFEIELLTAMILRSSTPRMTGRRLSAATRLSILRPQSRSVAISGCQTSRLTHREAVTQLTDRLIRQTPTFSSPVISGCIPVRPSRSSPLLSTDPSSTWMPCALSAREASQLRLLACQAKPDQAIHLRHISRRSGVQYSRQVLCSLGLARERARTRPKCLILRAWCRSKRGMSHPTVESPAWRWRGQPMSSRSANTERSWANPTAPTLPYPPPMRRSTLTAVQRWHCAAESMASPGAVTTTSVGRARSTLLVTGTMWTVRGRCASTPFAVTITAGRSNPGSLPAGIPKSTRTMSPASIVGSGCDTKVEPCAITAGQFGGAELSAHAPLSLGSQESRDFFVQGHAVEVSELPECVAGAG